MVGMIMARPSHPAIGDNGAMAKKTDNKGGKDKGKGGGGTIALNKRARHDYHLDERFEAGLALQGWELKAIRAGRANIGESYAVVRSGEMFRMTSRARPSLRMRTVSC